MSHGKHRERGSDAGSSHLVKRCAVVALLVSAIAVVSQAPASADSTVVAEPVARKMVTSSPQTTGPGGSLSWGLDRIDQRTRVSGSRSYTFATTGTGANIYVLDSGVDGDHPEFGSRVVNGWSYRASATALQSYSAALAANQQNPQTGIEPCANDGTHAMNPLTFDNPAQPDVSDFGRTDNDGHGSHVAGIAAGDSVGVAKNATIIPVRALDSCGIGTRTMIREALAWILADHDANEKAVLNLSVGFGEQVTAVDNDIIALMNEGILVVAAAGNSGTSACSSTPASTPGTISVGASTFSDAESWFSNFGDCVDILAPGGSDGSYQQDNQKIISAYPYLNGVSNTYAGLIGTSMAAPFVTGALARYLETLPTAPTTSATGNAAGWSWVSGNATLNAITYFNNNRSPQTANRLLYVPSMVPPSPVTSVSALPTNSGAVVNWAGNVAGVTYTATASPGNASCSVVGGNSCTIMGLTNGTTYNISVTGFNDGGTSAAVTTTVIAGLAPEAPASATAASGNKSITLTWSASSVSGASYVVTSSPPSAGCITTSTSCTVAGLTNGIAYTFFVSTTSPTGLASTSGRTISARPGFNVKRSTVKKGSRTLLTSMVTTPSRGKKTWSESGPCSISAGRLVAPRRTTSCVLRLVVARSGSYPKMSTSVKVTVK